MEATSDVNKTQIVGVSAPKDIVLDEIPNALVHTDKQLMDFIGYMNDCFEIKEQDLALVEESQFSQVRDDVCRQAVVYNHVVAPVCQNVLADASNFFNDFDNYFGDFEAMKDNIDLILEDSQKICQGFDITKKIHDPVLKEATINGKKAKTVQDEIMNKNADFQKQYEQMKANVATLRKKADQSKVSNMWAIVPVIGWAYMGIKKNNRKKYKKALAGKEEEVTEAEAGIFNIQKVLVQVEDNLLPALQSYLEAVQGLQAIFQQFHIECKGLKSSLEKTNNKIEQDAAEKQLMLLYNGLKNKGQRIGNACSTSVNLYNQLTSQFDALQQFN